MLKSCPHFRGKLRNRFNFALRERFRARLEGNIDAETLEIVWSDPCHVAAQTQYRFRWRSEWARRAIDLARGSVGRGKPKVVRSWGKCPELARS